MALLIAIIAIAAAFHWLNPHPALNTPPGVTLIDPTKDSTQPISFEFVTLPGDPTPHRLSGTFTVSGGEVHGNLHHGTFTTTDQLPYVPPFLTKLTFNICYIHPVNGMDQKDVFPLVGKTDNSIPLNIRLKANMTYELPVMQFTLKIPTEAQPNRTWLCAAIENPAGYFVSQ